MQFILVNMDLMGKSVGILGDKIIAQYDFVDHIITNLEDVTALLDNVSIDEDHIRQDIEERLEKALVLEQEISQLSNPPVNQFCLANEVHSGQLLHIPLKPVVPPETKAQH